MAHVYRAYFAIPPMATRKGVPTNAVFGFRRMIESLMIDIMPDYVAVAFDTKEPTFRHIQYADYKAQRPPMPDELVCQLPLIKRYVSAVGIPSLEYPGYEADDVIATYAVHAAQENINTLIATSDKDLCQLVSDSIALVSCSMGTHEVTDADGVWTKFGVKPEQIIDYLTLVGDASDNIPGVRGIGKVTAEKLLRKYSSLKNILAHIDELAPRVHTALTQAKDTLDEIQNLVTVVKDVPVTKPVYELITTEPQEKEISTLYEELEFSHGKSARTQKIVQGTLF